MEETQNTEQQPNYIELSEDSHNVGNIFNELSGELGDLDFAKGAVEQEVHKKDPLKIAYDISRGAFLFGIAAAVLLSIDVFARSSTDNSMLANLPICSYLAMGTNDYDNKDCKTLPQISAEVSAEKDKLEKNIAANLILLVPKLMQSMDIANSPKVQFIQEHTGDSRISLSEMTNRFLEIKNKTNYQGEDIECTKISLDEKWQISASCLVYGGSIIAPVGLTTKTSRETALSFLSRLDAPKSGFRVLSYPKTLDIAEFNSTDGFKTVFSTQTSLQLQLQYLPANKM